MPTWTTTGYTLPVASPMGRTPTPDPPSEISAGRKLLAYRAGAQWISADGLVAYTNRFGSIWRANWREEEREFGVWWPEGEKLPEGAIQIEQK